MSNYYIPCQIAPGVWHIYEPANVYSTLIVGKERALLIDTGYGYGNLREITASLTDLPLTVVNSHGHFDHAGGNYQFDCVYINRTELPVYFWYLTEVKPVTTGTFLKLCGSGKSEVIPKTLDVEWYLQQNNRHFEMLKDQQVFDLGGRTVTAIFLPGHTVGSTVFLDSLTEILFSGDDISPNLWIQFEHSAPLYDYTADLIKLKKYPISGIVSSHIGTVMPAGLIDWIEFAISNIDDTQAQTFVHPRTGRKSLMFRQPVEDEAMDGIKKINIVYDKNHKFAG